MKRKGAKKTRPEAQRLKKTTVYRALYTLASWEMVEDTGRTRTGPSRRPTRV
jgi:Fe2+ or Zn2+ uptake regulation protein